MVRTLEEQGHTYVIDDGVYFDVSTFPRYAEFAGLDLDELATSGRVEHVEAKRTRPTSPCGSSRRPACSASRSGTRRGAAGFPGWHIECSAMATKYLGTSFDIHTGGVDHIRVHHTNEVAQSECVLGVHPWVRIWMHNEFLDLGGEKISKSKGHVLVVDTLVERGFDPMAFRYFFLQAHYRQQQAFTWEAIEAAANAHRRLVGHAVAGAGGAAANRTPSGSAPHLRRFWEALADDLNAPSALAAVWDAVRDPDLSPADVWAFLADADRALGFGLAEVDGAGRRRERLRPADRRAGGRAGGGAGGQGLRHVRSHPRRAGRRGHRADRHADGSHLAPGMSSASSSTRHIRRRRRSGRDLRQADRSVGARDEAPVGRGVVAGLEGSRRHGEAAPVLRDRIGRRDGGGLERVPVRREHRGDPDPAARRA